MVSRWGLALALTMLAARGGVWPTGGWPVSTPEEQGMDSAMLAQADAYIAANCPTRRSFLAIRNGRLVWERYFGGAQPEGTHHIASISKGFLAALAGFAHEEGWLPDFEAKVVDYFPEYAVAAMDATKREITLRHLLTMSAGLSWNEAGSSVGAMINSPNWIEYVLNLPVQAAPGTMFNYNTGLSHVFSGILTKATGRSTEQYAREKVFGPLGIATFTWGTDPQGYTVGGFRLNLTSRDTAKLGYLFLRDGKWEDSQLLPRGWAQQCWKQQATNWAFYPEIFGDYGYFWWIRRMAGLEVKAAMGYGGQYVFVVPDLDLIVVTTAAADNDTAAYHNQASVLMTSYVLPAVQSSAPAVTAGGVVNAASFTAPVAPDSFVSVFGQNLAGASRDWDSVITDGRTLPVAIGPVSARIDGKDCYVAYVSPEQVNVLLPPDVTPGRKTLELTNWSGGASVEVEVTAAAPGLFGSVRGGKTYPAGYMVSDGAVLGEREAAAGEYLALFATGLGATATPHPAGQALREAYPLADAASVRVTMGGKTAPVLAAVMTFAGVYQINVEVPEGVSGEATVTLEAGGKAAQAGVVLPVRGAGR